MIRARFERDELGPDAALAVGQAILAGGIERIAVQIIERVECDNGQAVAVHITVIRQQISDANLEDFILRPLENAVILRHRVVVHRLQIHPDAGGGFAPELVADRVFEEGVAIVIRRAEEVDRIPVDQRRFAIHAILNRDDLKELKAFGRVVFDQVGGGDDGDHILVTEGVNIVFCVEAPGADHVFHRRAVPDRPVGEDDLFDAGFAPDEMVGDAQRVDQEAVVALQLQQKVVAFADNRGVLRVDVGHDNAVGVGGVAKFGHRVGRRVEAEPVFVRPEPACDQIIAKPAVDDVGAGGAGDRVDEVRPTHHFDVRKLVAQRLTRRAGPGGEVKRDAFVRRRVVSDVEARAAVDDIGAASAANDVVRAVADDRVVVVGALDDLDPRENVAKRIAAASGPVDHVDRDALKRERVVSDIDTRAAKEAIRASAADQDVVASARVDQIVAPATAQQVVPAVPGQNVVKIGADQVLDGREDVALRIAARRRSGQQRDADRRRREEIVGGIRPRPAIDEVALSAAFERIIVRAAKEAVDAAPAFENVAPFGAFQPVGGLIAAERVGIGGADQRLDGGIDIALGVAALPDPAAEIGAHADVGAGKVNGVKTFAAVDIVEPVAAEDQVVARLAEDVVIAGAAVDDIVAVARIDQVVAETAIDAVDAAFAIDVVGAALAQQFLIQMVADDEVAKVRPDLPLEVVILNLAKDEGGVFQPLRVADRIGQRLVADITGAKADDDELVVVDLCRSSGGRFDTGKEDRVVFDIRVILQNGGDADDHRHVQPCQPAVVVLRFRIVVHRDHLDVDKTFGRAVGVVGDRVIEAVALVGVQIRREENIALFGVREDAIQIRLPPRGIAVADELKRIAVDIGVIRQQVLDADNLRDILDHLHRVVADDRRRIADIVEIERDGRAVGQPVFVRDDVVEAGRAPVILIRREDDRAVRRQFNIAVQRARERLKLDRVAFDVIVIE